MKEYETKITKLKVKINLTFLQGFLFICSKRVNKYFGLKGLPHIIQNKAFCHQDFTYLHIPYQVVCILIYHMCTTLISFCTLVEHQDNTLIRRSTDLSKTEDDECCNAKVDDGSCQHQGWQHLLLWKMEVFEKHLFFFLFRTYPKSSSLESRMSCWFFYAVCSSPSSRFHLPHCW